MRIDIDGSEIQMPPYAVGVSSYAYHDAILSAKPTTNQERGYLLDRLDRDPNYWDLVAGVIRNGKHHHGSQLASKLADHLAGSGEPLELTCTDGLRAFREGWTWRDIDEAQALSVYALGVSLNRGTLVFDGRVGEIEGLNGGTVVIRGSVGRISVHHGVVYVDGDVDVIGDTSNGVIVVAGRVGQHRQEMRYQIGTRIEMPRSPFIFTTHPLELRGWDSWKTSVGHPEPTKTDVAPTFVVAEDRLRGWPPAEVAAQALRLCRERVSAHLRNLDTAATNITDIPTMARFAQRHLFGYERGVSAGYYVGSQRPDSASSD